MHSEGLSQLLYEALEREKSGILVYETALRCVVNEDLREELAGCLAQLRNRERILRSVFEDLDLKPVEQTSPRDGDRHTGQPLVEAMESALDTGDRVTAQLVAVECVVEAELARQEAREEMLRQPVEAGRF